MLRTRLQFSADDRKLIFADSLDPFFNFSDSSVDSLLATAVLRQCLFVLEYYFVSSSVFSFEFQRT